MTADVTGEAGDLAVDRARVEALRRSLGAHLATYRRAAGLSQPELGQVLGRTRSMVSKVEHGTRGMPETLWKITDEVCGAEGALLAECHTLAGAEQDYRDRYRAHHRQMQQSQAQAQVDALRALPASSLHDGESGCDVWPEMTRVSRELAGELMAVVTKLVRAMGRREAMRVVGWALAAVGLSGLDAEECTRLAQALETPRRVDAHVVENLATTLAYCKRLEDKLGPCEVLDTVIAQHKIVRRLLEGGCPERWRKPLHLVDSSMASAIGGYLGDMGQSEAARRYCEHARRAGHDASNPACAAYAAANTSFAAFQRADTPAALDTAAAARSLAARTDDPRLKALTEQTAAGAYALDGQYGPCMAACARAHDFLTSANGCAPDSPAYWVHHGALDSNLSTLFSLLGKPREAVEAALNAQAQFDRTHVQRYTRCQIRLGHALVLSKDITEAARILGDAANQANLSPRLTAELHTARGLMQPWQHSHAVTTLDAQLEACGLIPARQAKSTTPGSVAHRDQRA